MQPTEPEAIDPAGHDGPPLLDEQQVLQHLVERGIVPPGPMRAQALSGGVSNVVYRCWGPDWIYVVKQSLSRLLVADEWNAPRARLLTEAAALTLTHEMTPDHGPRVINLDPDKSVLVIEHAPTGWQDWKTELLDGRIDPGIAAHLGGILAQWHTQSTHMPDRLGPFDQTEAFQLLRVDPYYNTVATAMPDVAGDVHGVVERMLATRACLVHGDYSPKNVLVGAGGTWVIDHEVAHLGDPHFDLAFLSTHLLLKSIHDPGRSADFGACLGKFQTTYKESIDPVLASDGRYLAQQIGCLLLARVVGKSPVGYLDTSQQSKTLELGRSLLTCPPSDAEDIWFERERLDTP